MWHFVHFVFGNVDCRLEIEIHRINIFSSKFFTTNVRLKAILVRISTLNR